MVEVPIKRAMIAGAGEGGPARRRRQVLDDRLGARLRRRRARRRRHRRAAPEALRGELARRRDRGDPRMKLSDRRRRRVPGPARLRRAAAPPVERLGLDEVVAARHRRGAAGADRAACSTGWRPSTAQRLPFRRHDRPRRRRRGRRLRVLRDPRRPARGPRGRRGRPARARRARAGDDRPGRHLLRAAHDPGDGRARRDDRAPRAAGLADQLHEPRGHGHRGGPAGARRPRGRHLRLAVGPLPARRRRARPRRRRAVVRLLRPQPPRLAARRARRARASCSRSCSPTTRR